MTLGLAPAQGDLWLSTTEFCGARVAPDSIYGVLHRECVNLFPDEMFADLFTDIGRRSVPPMIVATVMVLQRVEGCSDREAVDRFAFDARWKYAAGGLAFDYPEFVHTVLVDMRARLAASGRPERIFEAVLDVARKAGLVGRRRVLDSTPLYDAVATMDTVTLVRSAVRGLLRAAGKDLEPVLRARLERDDDYATAGKPACDYDDRAAREALIHALAKDAYALLVVLDGRELDPVVEQAARLLAQVVGQDLDQDEAGVFKIARKVAKDRIISTVDPQARHGHKTAAHGFDGYKGHIAVDPDSEIITNTTVTPGNTADGAAAMDLLTGDLPDKPASSEPAGNLTGGEPASGDEGVGLDVYGDCAYGAGDVLEQFQDHGVDATGCKVAGPSGRGGMFTKDDFVIDLDTGQVTCPAGQVTDIKPVKNGGGLAAFGQGCQGCPFASQCTKATKGRTIRVGPHEQRLADARARQKDPDWVADYRATRPKVERKIAHLMRRKHGGRNARVRGVSKVAADFSLLAAAMNLARLARLGLAHQTNGNWTTVTV